MLFLVILNGLRACKNTFYEFLVVALGGNRKFWKHGFQLSLFLGAPSSEFQNLQSLDSQARRNHAFSFLQNDPKYSLHLIFFAYGRKFEEKQCKNFQSNFKCIKYYSAFDSFLIIFAAPFY